MQSDQPSALDILSKAQQHLTETINALLEAAHHPEAVYVRTTLLLQIHLLTSRDRQLKEVIHHLEKHQKEANHE